MASFLYLIFFSPACYSFPLGFPFDFFELCLFLCRDMNLNSPPVYCEALKCRTSKFVVYCRPYRSRSNFMESVTVSKISPLTIAEFVCLWLAYFTERFSFVLH
jgi:hypothetical protein